MPNKRTYHNFSKHLTPPALYFEFLLYEKQTNSIFIWTLGLFRTSFHLVGIWEYFCTAEEIFEELFRCSRMSVIICSSLNTPWCILFPRFTHHGWRIFLNCTNALKTVLFPSFKSPWLMKVLKLDEGIHLRNGAPSILVPLNQWHHSIRDDCIFFFWQNLWTQNVNSCIKRSAPLKYPDVHYFLWWI